MVVGSSPITVTLKMWGAGGGGGDGGGNFMGGGGPEIQLQSALPQSANLWDCCWARWKRVISLQIFIWTYSLWWRQGANGFKRWWWWWWCRYSQSLLLTLDLAGGSGGGGAANRIWCMGAKLHWRKW